MPIREISWAVVAWWPQSDFTKWNIYWCKIAHGINHCDFLMSQNIDAMSYIYTKLKEIKSNCWNFP